MRATGVAAKHYPPTTLSDGLSVLQNYSSHCQFYNGVKMCVSYGRKVLRRCLGAAITK